MATSRPLRLTGSPHFKLQHLPQKFWIPLAAFFKAFTFEHSVLFTVCHPSLAGAHRGKSLLCTPHSTPVFCSKKSIPITAEDLPVSEESLGA